MSTNTQGYAIRRNSTCGDEEVLCHKTWENEFAVTQACCPKDSHCNNSGQPNTICCPNGLNCTKEIESKPATCADQRWNLYNWDGEFCCDPDQSGYYIAKSIWVGCYVDSSDVNGKYIGLPIVSTGSLSSTPAAATSTSTSTATSTSTSAASAAGNGGSHTNTGAIAGGVVGGVVGVAAILIALYFILRLRKRPDAPSPQPSHESPPSVVVKNTHPRELEDLQLQKPHTEAVLEYPPQPEYPGYPVSAQEYYSHSQQVASSEYSNPQVSAYSNQYSQSTPSDYTPAGAYTTQQLHELPTDQRSRRGSK